MLAVALLASSLAAPFVDTKGFPDRRAQLVWTRGMSASLADPPCKTAADCADKHMTSPECVEQTGGDWSQCVDCDATAFQDSCKYWTDRLLKPAEAACKLQCTGIAPPPPAPKLTCRTDADCKDAAHPSCVVQADGTYAQCVSCNSTVFESDCVDWEKTKFLPAAEKKCGEKCTGPSPPSPSPKPKLACHTDADCTDAAHPDCAIQSDGTYAQCITCDEAQFQLDCVDWEKIKFLPAAEAKCDLKCTGAVTPVEEEATDCESLSTQAACDAAKCSWCKAGAVPDSCKNPEDAKKLPPSVFQCDNI